MAKIVLYAGLIFGVLLAGLGTKLAVDYQTPISPNWFLYTHTDWETATTSLNLLNFDRDEQRVLTDKLSLDSDGRVREASWAPDGHWIYFQAVGENGVNNLYRRHFAMSEPQLVIANWATHWAWDNLASLRWTPDAQWIIHQRIYKDTYAYYRMRPDGSDVKRLTGQASSYFSLSPDSQWLYYNQREPQYGLYRVNLDGTQHMEVYSEYLGALNGWSPDGEWMYFNGPYEGAQRISRLRADGREFEQLTPVTEDVLIDYQLRRWSSDGARFIYSTDTYDYYVYDIGRRQSTFIMHGTDFTFPFFSSDNQVIYVYDFQRGIYPVVVGESIEPDWFVQDDTFSFKGWSAGMTGFYYQLRHEDTTEILHFDIPTRQTTQLIEWEASTLQPTYVAPDGESTLILLDYLCWGQLGEQHLTCLTDSDGGQFRGWMPDYVDKKWHPNPLLLLAGGLIVGCGGGGVYLSRRNLW